MIPGGMIQAVTNQSIGLKYVGDRLRHLRYSRRCSVIAELLGGFLVPGRPVALMFFKTFGYVTMGQALAFTGDLSA